MSAAVLADGGRPYSPVPGYIRMDVSGDWTVWWCSDTLRLVNGEQSEIILFPRLA